MKRFNKVIKYGNYACSFGQAYAVVDRGGYSPCVLEQHGAITGVIVNERKNTKRNIKKI